MIAALTAANPSTEIDPHITAMTLLNCILMEMEPMTVSQWSPAAASIVDEVASVL
jgi:hypothetical protein